ncbi:MAG: tetratricopeptide repeat protein [Gammaproteobacteria bacterium]|nr:tetratricopeptide repeat protein [Gammaproteobacteria bacterium]
MADVRSNLEAMLARGQDSALLRFSLGNLCLQGDDPAAAVEHLQQALAQDAGYSAAWKLLGRALLESGDRAGAQDAWQQGIEVATGRGDMQAAREMQVFLRRLERES